jgi:hypothetical protein
MAQRTHADPYLVSGRSAASSSLLRMKQEAFQRSVADAESLARQGRKVLARCSRGELGAAATITLATPVAGLTWIIAIGAYDGTYEGAATGNWCMLGFTVCLGAIMFGWGWWSSLRRLRETGKRLLARADYQTKLATLQLSEIENATVR